MTLLSDLPNEILLETFDQLNDLTLRRLSKTSQRLRQVAQTVLTKKHLLHLHSMANAGIFLSDGDQSLQGLLRHKMPSKYPLDLALTIFLRRIYQDLEAFRTLLVRLRRVSLNLKLSPVGSVSRDFDQLEPRWAHLLSEIMNIVVEKSHSELTVERGDNWGTLGRPFHYEYTGTTLTPSHSSNDHPSPVQTRNNTLLPFLRPIWRILGGFVAKLRSRPTTLDKHVLQRRKRDCAMSLSLVTTSGLEQFNIHSSFLLELPFFHWTMAILAISPITTLSFDNIQLTHYDWEYILSSLSIKTLLHISFGSVDIAFPDLQKFLARHTSIMTLDLSRNNAIGSLKPFSSQSLLPNLNHLIASSEYLAHFLEPASAFPALQSVTMVTGYTGGLTLIDYQILQFDIVLRRISGREHRLALIFRFVSVLGLQILNTWLRNIHMRVRTQVMRIDDVPNVVKLEVFVDISPASDMLDALISSFPIFPSLKHLKFSTSFWNANSDPSATLRTIWETLPGLETIDGQGRP